MEKTSPQEDVDACNREFARTFAIGDCEEGSLASGKPTQLVEERIKLVCATKRQQRAFHGGNNGRQAQPLRGEQVKEQAAISCRKAKKNARIRHVLENFGKCGLNNCNAHLALLITLSHFKAVLQKCIDNAAKTKRRLNHIRHKLAL